MGIRFVFGLNLRLVPLQDKKDPRCHCEPSLGMLHVQYLQLFPTTCISEPETEAAIKKKRKKINKNTSS